MDNAFYYPANARNEHQRDKMMRLESAGLCMFCPEHLAVHQETQVTMQTDHWLVCSNLYPYRGTRIHLLVIPKRHVIDMADLSPDEWREFGAITVRLKAEYELDAYGIAIRNGDPGKTGGTIRHVHAHVIVGDTDDPDHEPVKVKLTSRPAD